MPTFHKYEHREDGLNACKVCRGGEGSLPSMCPGRPMTSDEQDEVYAGKLDFDVSPMRREPCWWTKKD